MASDKHPTALNEQVEPRLLQIRLETVSFAPSILQRLYQGVKRLFDFGFSAFFLVLLAFPLCIIALLIKLDSPGPVIFRQDRMGQKGKPFTIFKFRTMKTTAPSAVATAQMTGAQNHITKVGSFLRRTSLDELPQLINILRGDMSLIGYRPLIPSEAEIHQFRLDNQIYFLKPGLTGWSQINGRDDLSLTHKMLLDREYLHQFGFLTDLKIFFKTIAVVFKRDGVAF